MKKTLIFIVCAIIALSVVGCKTNKDEKSTPDTKVETKDEKNINSSENLDKKESEEKTEINEDTNTPSAEAPAVESMEELEGMVNEFNTTEDPERKEELRKQLETILSQAEAAAETTK